MMAVTDDLLRILSNAPGRLRVHLPEMDSARAEALAEVITAVPGVQCAAASALTHNLLVHYDPARLGVDELQAIIAAVACRPRETTRRLASRGVPAERGKRARLALRYGPSLLAVIIGACSATTPLQLALVGADAAKLVTSLTS